MLERRRRSIPLRLQVMTVAHLTHGRLPSAQGEVRNMAVEFTSAGGDLARRGPSGLMGWALRLRCRSNRARAPPTCFPMPHACAVESARALGARVQSRAGCWRESELAHIIY